MTVNVETVNGVSKFHTLDKDMNGDDCRILPSVSGGNKLGTEDIPKFGKKIQAIDSWFMSYSAPGIRGASTLRGGFANESAHKSPGYPFLGLSSFVEVDNNVNPIIPRLKLDINEYCALNWICYTWENRKKIMDKTPLNPGNVPDVLSYATVIYKIPKNNGILGFPIESYGWVTMADRVDIPLNVEGSWRRNFLKSGKTIVLSSNTTWKGDYQVCMYLKDKQHNVTGPYFINFKVEPNVDVSRKDSGAPKSPEEDDIPYCMDQHFDEKIYYRNKFGTDVSLTDFVQCANEEEAYFKKTTECHDIDDYCSRIWCDNKEKYPAEFSNYNDPTCNPNKYNKSSINLFAPMSCVMTVDVETVNGVSKFYMLDKDPYKDSCRITPRAATNSPGPEDIPKFGKKLQAIHSWYSSYSKGGVGGFTLRGGFANESAHISHSEYPYFSKTTGFVEVDNNANPKIPRLKLKLNKNCYLNWICYTWENRKKLMDRISLDPSNNTDFNSTVISPYAEQIFTPLQDLLARRRPTGTREIKEIRDNFERVGFQIESYGFRNVLSAEGAFDIPLNVEGNGTTVLSSNTTWKGDYQVCMHLKDSSFQKNAPIFINFKV